MHDCVSFNIIIRKGNKSSKEKSFAFKIKDRDQTTGVVNYSDDAIEIREKQQWLSKMTQAVLQFSQKRIYHECKIFCVLILLTASYLFLFRI
jgi:hypothetical protein